MPFLLPEKIAGVYDGEALGAGSALAEIAGRDSIGAVVALSREGSLKRILPSIAYTGTEYGSVDELFLNVEQLRLSLRPSGVEVMDIVILGSPLWWKAVIGRVNSILSRRYGPWHICVGCHMYLHAVRVPLAWETGAKVVVAGERLKHRGRTKINQSRPAVEAYRTVLKEWGIKLETPLLEVDEEEEILALTGDWDEGMRQTECVLSGNYLDLEGRPVCDEKRLSAYLEEYLMPVTSRILSSLREDGRADYQAIVQRFLR